MRTPKKCDSCKTGAQLQVWDKQRQNKEISKIQFMDKIKKLTGEKCFPCMHNGIHGLKIRAMKLVSKTFQEFDMYEPND